MFFWEYVLITLLLLVKVIIKWAAADTHKEIQTINSCPSFQIPRVEKSWKKVFLTRFSFVTSTKDCFLLFAPCGLGLLVFPGIWLQIQDPRAPLQVLKWVASYSSCMLLQFFCYRHFNSTPGKIKTFLTVEVNLAHQNSEK